jgi:hypothetical protein
LLLLLLLVLLLLLLLPQTVSSENSHRVNLGDRLPTRWQYSESPGGRRCKHSSAQKSTSQYHTDVATHIRTGKSLGSIPPGVPHHQHGKAQKPAQDSSRCFAF